MNETVKLISTPGQADIVEYERNKTFIRPNPASGIAEVMEDEIKILLRSFGEKPKVETI